MNDDFLESWTDYVDDENASLYELVYQLVSKTVLLPECELYFKLLSIFCCSSVINSKIFPRLFCYGQKGSGKSEITKLIARVRNQPILASKTTYASIRNIINSNKLYDPDLGDIPGNEKDGSMLCWDNLRPDTLLIDSSLYQLLISGYSKSTSIIMVSSGVTGKNLVFNCFTPAIFSSVFPLHIDFDFEELHRRMITIPHKKANLFTKQELAKNEELSGLKSVFDKLSVDECDFSGISQRYFEYWNESTSYLHSNHRKLIQKSAKNKASKFREYPSEYFLLLSDLLATGLTLGAFKEVEECEEFFKELMESQEKIHSQSESATELLLQEFILEATTQQREINSHLIANNLKPVPLRIPAEQVKTYLDSLAAQGRLDKQIRVTERNKIMNSLGYRLDAKSWVEIK